MYIRLCGTCVNCTNKIVYKYNMCNVKKIFWGQNVLSDKVNARGMKKLRFFTMRRSVEIQ